MSASVLASFTLAFVKISFGSWPPVTLAFLLIPPSYWSLLFRSMTESIALASTLVRILDYFVF